MEWKIWCLIASFCRDYLLRKKLCNLDRYKKLRRTTWPLKVSNERDWISSKEHFQSFLGSVEKDKEVREKENVDKYLKRYLEEVEISWNRSKNSLDTNKRKLFSYKF